MKPTFCSACGGADFCLPHCIVSSGVMQYYQRSVWYLRIMLTLATSADRRSYWTRELAQAQAQLDAATTGTGEGRMKATTYPTAIHFDLIEPTLRQRVLDAAFRLGFAVQHDGPREFYVTVTSEKDAYALGHASNDLTAKP